MRPSSSGPASGVLIPHDALYGRRLEQSDDFNRPERGYSVRAVASILNRHKGIIGTCIGVITLITTVIAFSLPKTYVAEAIVILDTRRTEVVQQPAVLSNLVNGTTADTAIVRSEVAMLSSASYARKLVEQLDLLHNPLFTREMEPSPWKASLGSMFSDVQKSVAEKLGLDLTTEAPNEMGRAVLELSKHLSVYNDDRSYAIALRYESPHPQFAATVVNALARLYVADQMDRRLEVAKKAGIWLKDQLGPLAIKVQASEHKVAEFEQRNGIGTVLVGNLTEQRVHELTMQLLASSDDLSRKQTTLNQAREMMKTPGGAAAAAQVLSSPLIQKLREQEADAAAKTAALQGVYNSAYAGGDPRTREFNQRIGAEVQRIMTSLVGEVSAAKERQTMLQDAIAQEQKKLDAIGAARVQLVQLQHEATVNRNLYDSYLVRAQQIEADEQALQSAARVVQADTPVTPSFPNKLLLIGFGFFGSAFLGVILAFIAEQLDETIRTPDDAARVTGMPTLGIVPKMRSGARALSAIVDAPLSAYTDAINNILIALGAGQRHGANRVVAITSAVPAEGKTLIAAAVARAAASRGIRTLLIDCDLRRPQIASLFGDKAPSNLETMFKQDSTDIPCFAHDDAPSGLSYLSARRRGANPQQVLGSRWLQAVIAKARTEYDLVVLDTPPLLTVSDALLLTGMTDTTLLVVRWGRTPSGLVTEALRILQLHTKCSVGTVLSMVDMRKYLRYRAGGYYYGGAVRRRISAGDAAY